MLQPVLSISCPVEALVYVNGRIAGDAGGVTLPVAPEGRQFLQIFPLNSAYLPTTCAVTWHKGRPELSCSNENVYIVEWPNGYVQADITPLKVPKDSKGARRVTKQWEQGGDSLLVWQGDEGYAWEAYANGRPALSRRLSHCKDGVALYSRRMREGWQVAVKGRNDDGAFLHVLSFESGQADVTLDVSGDDIETLPDGRVKVLSNIGDVTGRALYTIWSPDGGAGFVREGSEVESGEAQPQGLEETAIAALQAMRFGMIDEAGLYFAPSARGKLRDFARDIADYDNAVRLPHPLPGGASAVGVMRLIGERHAVVEAISYAGEADAAGNIFITQMAKA